MQKRFGERTRTVLLILLLLSGLLSGCAQGSSPTGSPTTEAPDAVPVTAAPASPTVEEVSTVSPDPAVEPEASQTLSSEDRGAEPAPVRLQNPGFEEQGPGETPAGWETDGEPGTVVIEENGRSGGLRLTHRGTAPYQVETRQAVTGLANGWYTLRGWIRSSGGQESAYLALRCGNEERRVHLPPTTPGYRWIQLTVSNQVTDGQCAILLHSAGSPDTWASFDDIELAPGQTTLSILGADISSLHKSEVMGGVYRDAEGRELDALQILRDNGLNYARLRVWVDPADGYHDKEEILLMAQRLKRLDIKLLVDFHYSDYWADPGKQIKPSAWEDYDFEQLKKAVYDHTFDVCQSLVEQGTPPDMVQVGNEINAGMLWPDGDYEHFDNLAALLAEGSRAVKDCSASTPVMLHIAEGGDNDLARWWFGNITRREVPFDVIGISYYPYWHGSLGELQYNLNDISARYDKDVIVVETAYAFTGEENDHQENIFTPSMEIPGYPLTPEGQRKMLRDVMAIVRAVPDGRGLGVFYWDATWTAVSGNGWEPTDPESGNGWENQALFDYDGRVLPALENFRP